MTATEYEEVKNEIVRIEEENDTLEIELFSLPEDDLRRSEIETKTKANKTTIENHKTSLQEAITTAEWIK